MPFHSVIPVVPSGQFSQTGKKAHYFRSPRAANENGFEDVLKRAMRPAAAI